MDYGVFDAVTVELLAAYALHQRTWFLRWQFFAGLPHSVFSSGPVSLVAPFPKVGLGSFRQKPRGCVDDRLGELVWVPRAFWVVHSADT